MTREQRLVLRVAELRSLEVAASCIAIAESAKSEQVRTALAAAAADAEHTARRLQAAQRFGGADAS